MSSEKPPILIVDDEADVLLSLTGLLRRDFQVHTANSGAEALEVLKQHAVHVIMTDQRMPEMTGVQLMEQAANTYPQIIRIVFTGYADTRAVVEAINTGDLYRYITKPWDPEDLIAILHRAAEKYRATEARLELLEALDDYFDTASRIASAAESNVVEDGSIAEFRETTERLRDFLKRCGD